MAYSLNPSRALLHPAWLASLAVLALNDHVLKGADILPAALTGKLSDVAGLLVAPLLLAVLLRVHRVPTWLGCHLAVGVVFAAIQLSPAVAGGWSGLMGAVGFPWVITMDATDLWTLPALALSAWGFLPAMRRSTRATARRSAECGVAMVGLWCSAATSAPDPCEDRPCDDGWEEPEEEEMWEEPQSLPPFQGDLYVNNASGIDQVIRIRALRDDVSIDCDTVAENPGALLRSSLFQPAVAWTLPPDTNVALVEHTPGQAICYAAWVEADAMSPTIAFWFDGAPPVVTVPGQTAPGLPGELLMMSTTDQVLSLGGDQSFLNEPQPREPEEHGVCAAQPDAQRVGWSTPVPWGSARVEAIESGVDDCLAIDLRRGEQSVETWYLCVPTTSFPFAIGDDVDLRPLDGIDGDGLEIVATGELGEPLDLPMLTVSAGAMPPSIPSLELAALPMFSCDMASEATCGSVERPMSVVIGGPDLDAAELYAGDEPQQLHGVDRIVEVTVMHAQERFALDPACAQGPDQLGADIELVIAQRPAAE